MTSLLRRCDAAVAPVAFCAMVLSGCGGGEFLHGAANMTGVEVDRRVEHTPLACASFKNLKEDCTHKDLFTWKGDVQARFVKPSYLPSEYGSDTHWKTTKVSDSPGWETLCVAFVETGKHHKTCKHWCESHSNVDQQFVCNKGMDDAHKQRRGLYAWLRTEKYRPTYCTVNPATRELTARKYDGFVIDQTDNGCNAEWETQICGCALVREPSFPLPVGSWQNSPSGTLPSDAEEDCSFVDHHVYKDEDIKGLDPPSYAANTYGADSKWTTKGGMASETGPFPGASVAYVHTAGMTCKQWCRKENMRCVGGMDDAHHQYAILEKWQTRAGFSATNCTLYPPGHSRQSTYGNGCYQQWKTQICACKAV